jgi:hypothetical protein
MSFIYLAHAWYETDTISRHLFYYYQTLKKTFINTETIFTTFNTQLSWRLDLKSHFNKYAFTPPKLPPIFTIFGNVRYKNRITSNVTTYAIVARKDICGFTTSVFKLKEEEFKSSSIIQSPTQKWSYKWFYNWF